MIQHEEHLNNILQTIAYLPEVIFVTDHAFQICGMNRQARRLRGSIRPGQTLTSLFELRTLTDKQLRGLLERNGAAEVQVRPNPYCIQTFTVSCVTMADSCYYCWQEENRLPKILSEEKRLYRREMQWIGNYSELAASPEESENRTEWIYGMLRCTKNQFGSQLYTALKYGQLRLDSRPVDLHRLIRTCADYLLQGSLPGVTLMVENAASAEENAAGLFVELDELYFQQMLAHLLANAYEAVGESGTVRLRCCQAGRRAVIEVEDDGPGILEENRLKIWEPLFTEKADRLGLGLPLARLLAEEMGGTLELRATKSGALFCLSFPVLDSWKTVKEIPPQYADAFYRNNLDLTAILAEPCRQSVPPRRPGKGGNVHESAALK